MKLADTRDVLRDLRTLQRPALSYDRLEQIRVAVAAETGGSSVTGGTPASAGGSWTQRWLMPLTVGGFASLLMATLLVNALYISGVRRIALSSGGSSIDYVETATNTMPGSTYAAISPSEYVRTRMDVSSESPSVNPNGALIALTRSLMRGEMRDDEVVVVAEVFGNGLARIDEIVEPSHDRRAVRELQKALQSDPAFAPFVPAQLDGRSDSVKVILKLQTVDVKTRGPRNRKL